MTKIKLLAYALAASLLFGVPSAQAHCDSVDGPVAQAALKALDAKNVNLALPYAPDTAEAEIKASFAQSIKVRALGSDAKALADRAFIEAVVRLHRGGEGAPYTGLKPAGTDFGPAIPAAERAIDSGDLSEVRVLLTREMEHGLEARLAQVQKAQSATKEPKTADEIAAARDRIQAEFGFVAYIEGLREAAHGTPGKAHKE